MQRKDKEIGDRQTDIKKTRATEKEEERKSDIMKERDLFG
jgi:hypothetical protein